MRGSLLADRRRSVTVCSLAVGNRKCRQCSGLLHDDLIEQFFGLLLTSSMKAVQLKRTVTAVGTTSNNDLTRSAL